MDEKTLKVAAYALAGATPDHAGRSASPPQSWRLEGEVIVVLCADGRKVRAPVAQYVAARQFSPSSPKPSPTRTSTEGAGVMALPARTHEVVVRPPSGASGASGTSIKPQTPQKPQVPYRPSPQGGKP